MSIGLCRCSDKHGCYINCVNADQIVDFIKTKTTEATFSNTESATPANDDPWADINTSTGSNTVPLVDPNDVF